MLFDGKAGGLSPVMAYVPLSNSKVVVRYGALPEEAERDMVSGTFFSGLGVSLIRGRGFSEEDETNHASIAVISYNYWTQRFARNPDVLGTTLYVNGVAITGRAGGECRACRARGQCRPHESAAFGIESLDPD